jgi:membrane protease YdiL (CAAX protease family)
MSPSNSLSQAMRRHPLFCYFLIAFGFTWGYELLVYGILHLPLLPVGVSLVIVGPAAASVIMTSLTEEKPGVLLLLRRCVLWRVGLPWYLFVLLGIPDLTLLGFFVLPEGIAAFRAPAPAFGPGYIGLFIGIFFVVSLPEETGWRGFALPRLQQHRGPLVGTLILGALWALWHLPLFVWVPGYDGAGSGFVGILVAFAAFTVSTLALAIIFTWVFNHTRGSLLLLLLVLLATRRRLSYERYQSQGVFPATEAVEEQEPETVDSSA